MNQNGRTQWWAGGTSLVTDFDAEIEIYSALRNGLDFTEYLLLFICPIHFGARLEKCSRELSSGTVGAIGLRRAIAEILFT